MFANSRFFRLGSLIFAGTLALNVSELGLSAQITEASPMPPFVAATALGTHAPARDQRESFLQRKVEIRALVRGAEAAPDRQLDKSLAKLLNLAIEDSKALEALQISEKSDENTLVTATFALQPVLLEAIERLAIRLDSRRRVAYHVLRADRERLRANVRAFPNSFEKEEIISWAREVQRAQPKIRKEIELALEALGSNFPG